MRNLRGTFLKRFITRKVYTASTRTSNKIVPLNKLNKYLNYDTRKGE